MDELKNKKHLFFDLDDTLWDFAENSSAVLEVLFEKYGLSKKLNTDYPSFLFKYRSFNLELWSLFYKRKIDKYYMRDHRFNEVFLFFGYNNYNENLLFSNDYMSLAPLGTALKPGCIETLTYLQKKYQLHIITNGFADSQAIKIERCKLSSFFANIIVSEDYGLVKPELEIFRVAERLAGASPANCVMIGDSIESDVEGALNAGWSSIYFAEDHIHDYKGISIKKLQELQVIF